MIENMRLSLQGIWLHKMRSFLTMLGIIIGIASIISIVSTIKGTNEQIKENLIGSGNNTVTVSLFQSDMEYEGDSETAITDVAPITDSDMDEIKDIPEVSDVSRYVSRGYAEGVNYLTNSLSGGRILGVEKNYLDVAGYKLVRGRSFVSDDYSSFRKVVLIDDIAERVLFGGESGRGKTIDIQGEPFTVIGIIEDKASKSLSIETLDDYYTYTEDSAGVVIMPDASWPIIYQYDELQNVVVKARDTDSMSAAGKKVAEVLNQNIGNNAKEQEVKYKAEDLLETVRSLQQLSDSTNWQLIWIASIALLVGGIGVMNIMLVSVTERTREIGLKKAIGAPNKTIMMQFLTEAAVLSSLGGVLGVIVGIILSQIISRISAVPVAISVPATIMAVLFSMAIGIVFGLVPSVKASKLNPIDALRRE